MAHYLIFDDITSNCAVSCDPSHYYFHHHSVGMFRLSRLRVAFKQLIAALGKFSVFGRTSSFLSLLSVLIRFVALLMLVLIFEK
jgi:hypothetical protein